MVKKLDDRPAPRPSASQTTARTPAPKPAPKKPAASTGVKFSRDELSTGRTSALRARALGMTGATLVPVGAPDVRASVGARPAAQSAATAALPPDTGRRVDAAAQAVRDAGANLPPGQRERAMAEELERQSAQFRDDPEAGAALARSLQPELDEISRDLSRRITANDDSQTHETVRALAGAAENLGATAALELGRAFARAIPDVRDLNQFDDALANAGANGEATLLLATTQAFRDAGKGEAAGELMGDVGTCAHLVDDRFTPVDPSRPDAVAEAQLRVLAATASPNGGYGADAYAAALWPQVQALQSDPAALKAFADAQGGQLVELLQGSAYSQGQNVDLALRLAEASGPARLAEVADAYAATLNVALPENGPVAGAMSPASAAAVAFALQRAGKADIAQPFAARAADSLDGVTAAARDANDRVGALQGQLNQELAQVGAALTPDQRAAYQAEFWRQHQPELDQARAANAALQAAVTQQLPSLQGLAPNSPEVAEAVANSLKELARDPSQNAFVVSTIESLKTNGAFPASFAGAERTLVEAYAVSQQARAGELLAQNDAAGAARVLEQVARFLGTTSFQSQDVKDFVEKGLPTIRDFTSAVSTAARTGDLSSVRAWLEDPAKAAQLDALSGVGGDVGRVLAESVAGMGVAVYLSKAATTPSELDRLVSVVKAGNTGAKVLAFGFNALAKMTNQAVSEALKSGAASLGSLLGRVTPIIGLGLSIFDALGGVGAAIDNPNIASVGNAIGNSLAAIGGAVALFPGGQGVGLALAVIGKGVGFLSNLIQGAHDEQARRDETQRILETLFAQPGGPLAGLPESERRLIAERLAQTRADVGALAAAGGLSPADVITLAREFPELMDPSFSRLAAVARATGASGADFVRLLRDAKARLGERFGDWLDSCLGPDAAYAWDARASQDAQGEATRIVAQTGEDYGTVFQREYARLKAEYEAQAVENFLHG